MKSLLDKMAAVERHLVDMHGPFGLFALVRRYGTHLWDVVVSAAWLPGESVEATTVIIDALKQAVGDDGMMSFSRVIVLPSDSDFLGDLSDAYQATQGRRRIGAGQIGRVDVDDGFLFRTTMAAIVPSH